MMPEEELKRRVAEAKEHLRKYVELVIPVAEDLAERKSMAIFGRPGGYQGKLGCWEAGIDMICLHIADGFQKEADGEDYGHVHGDKVRAFEDEWRKKLDINFNPLYLSGHY